MMKLDQNVSADKYEYITHNQIICSICAVVCHSNCNINNNNINENINDNINNINSINEEISCECDSDYHSNFK